MAERPQPVPQVSQPVPAASKTARRSREPRETPIHHVAFTAFPKLLYVWPLIVAGFAFWPAAQPAPAAAPHAASAPSTAAPLPETHTGVNRPAAASPAPAVSLRLERLGWAYVWIALIVVLALGVDLGRNQALVVMLLIAFVWVLGILLRDKYNFTLFGDIYRWLAALNVQYDRGLGLSLSILLAVPYVCLLGWARLNDRWRITPNEFEHFSFGRSSESLGRGAKSIRSEFPDFFEAVLGFGAGTLIVSDANGMRELRRIPNIPLLPLVRAKLYGVLERTAVTAAPIDDQESDGQQ